MADVKNIPVWRAMGKTPVPVSGVSENHRIVIVGGGPVGLALALDLGRRGQKVLLLNRLDCITGGSKAICFSKRSLDILDRLGVAQGLIRKSVVWNIGKVFWGDRPEPIYQFDMLQVANQKHPGFVNIQQYYVEDALLTACMDIAGIEIRWGHEVVDVAHRDQGAWLRVSGPGGEYEIATDWLIACDGSRSSVRTLLSLDFEGRVFEDNFLIADIKMEQDHPSERWFWFDPPFNPGQSALMHKQPDNIWRLDFQLGWDIDRQACIRPENVEPFVRAMLGDAPFTEEWYSVYTFQCRRMHRFVHSHVIFAGDSAHLVSPFGARGCNGGLADVDNLAWKLDMVVRGEAPGTLLESYNDEAIVAADENILNSTRSTDFLTPKSATSRVFRDAVLELAASQPFARPFVNSGRLSTAVRYPESLLNTSDIDIWDGGVTPGAPALDAPLGDGWLLDWIRNDFTLVADQWSGPEPDGVDVIDISGTADTDPILWSRYALTPGSAYLFRPDQYVAGRWKAPSRGQVEQAIRRAKGLAA